MPDVIINVALNVPALPDNAVAFANSAAWSAYWNGAGFTATIQAATTLVYGVVKAAQTATYVDPGDAAAASISITDDPNGDGNLVTVYAASLAYANAMNLQLKALNSTVKAMRTAMVNAGLITNAQ